MNGAAKSRNAWSVAEFVSTCDLRYPFPRKRNKSLGAFKRVHVSLNRVWLSRTTAALTRGQHFLLLHCPQLDQWRNLLVDYNIPRTEFNQAPS